MPLYDIYWNDCNKESEIECKLKDTIRCKSCGSKNVKKLISSITFVLKGGGWYNEGYTKKPKKNDLT